ncbi:hypothetical protein STRAU_2785 [Streptomyces aurantiacus JA 4570]|uniref:Uncharacterized protein n=1 Tax=Streptomyces aurantiacus JA 4570 TaxID=1286094 RepID=S3ZLP2_9ACTN|nr:hypothetical protein STRAU_2785 [Streptomyces aurantiacus JA 4570]
MNRRASPDICGVRYGEVLRSASPIHPASPRPRGTRTQGTPR